MQSRLNFPLRAKSGTPADSRNGLLAAWLFGLALFGYPVVAVLISLLQIDSRTLSIPFRLFVAAAGFVLLAKSPPLKLGAARSLLIFIWSTYTLRLLQNTFARQVEGADYALMFFFAGALIPAIALMAASTWHQTLFARISLALSVAVCMLVLIGNMGGEFGESDLTEASGRLNVVALNPISLANLAVSAILCAAVLWRKATVTWRLGFLIAIALAFQTLVATGSKGPALALAICWVVWSLRRVSARWPLILLALPVASFVLIGSESALLERVAASAEDLSTLDRLVLIENSLAQIAESPIFGSAFVELESGVYPHNILLEAAMALGIPIALAFAGLLIFGVSRAWQALDSPDTELLGLLYLQSIVEGAVSGAMFGAALMWITLALLLRPSAYVVSRVPKSKSKSKSILRIRE